MSARIYTLKALTDIWTGDAQGKPDRTITTGLLGSIRWWFEVLVRGLGGSACDPTDTQCRDRNHCVVCEFLGCTGWGRKFRFEVLNESGETRLQQIKKGDVFQFRFTAVRPVCQQDWTLLDLTLRLIAEYGAIGGKTVYKPSDEPGLADLDMSDFAETNGSVCVRRSRKGLPLQKDDIVLEVGGKSISSLQDLHDACKGRFHGEPVSVNLKRRSDTGKIEAWFGKRHHIDYGVIQVVETSPRLVPCDRKQLDSYILQERWRKSKHDDFAWASLANFWCVKGRYLARQNSNTSTFNRVISRPEPKKRSANSESWFAGRRARGQPHPQQPESKKVFSFSEPKSARRTFGFVKQGVVKFDDVKGRLKTAWPNLKDTEFLRGDEILKKLVSSAGGTP